MLASLQNLICHVVFSVMILSHAHFSGKNVTECAFILRNILNFLNHSKPVIDHAPSVIMDNLLNTFIESVNKQFQACMLNQWDFHHSMINKPERLFHQSLDLYQRKQPNSNF